MSRQPRLFAVFGFETTHDALDAEKLLLDLGVDVVPVPAPKMAGARCGIALRVELDDDDRAAAYLETAGISVAARGHIEDV